MLKTGSFFALLSLTLPLVTVAQVPATAPPVPRLFAGLSASFGGYPLPASAPWGAGGVNVATVGPVLGVQLRPRWALQLGAAYDEARSTTAYRYDTDPLLPGRYEKRTFRLRTLVVPVLARYALTRHAGHRFQAEAVGGASAVLATGPATVYRMHEGTVESSYRERQRSASACLTLGLGARYALWPRLEATAEAVLNRQVSHPTRSRYGANPNLSAGLRYRFGPTG
jgi:hypothetical protein